jgi:hypothetical protein
MPYKAVSVANTTEYLIGSPQSSEERVRLTGGVLVAANTVTVTLRSVAGTNTDLTGAMTLVAGTPLVFPSSPFSPGSGRRPGYTQTAANGSLYLVLGGNTQVSGTLEYELIAE